jgi:hypothetical protein
MPKLSFAGIAVPEGSDTMQSAFQPYTYTVLPGIPLLVLSCSEVKAPAEFLRFNAGESSPVSQGDLFAA